MVSVVVVNGIRISKKHSLKQLNTESDLVYKHTVHMH